VCSYELIVFHLSSRVIKRTRDQWIFIYVTRRSNWIKSTLLTHSRIHADCNKSNNELDSAHCMTIINVSLPGTRGRLIRLKSDNSYQCIVNTYL